MRLVGLLSFMVEHLQTAGGALVSVLFLKRGWACRETDRAKEIKYSLGTLGSGRRLHNVPYYSISQDSQIS